MNPAKLLIEALYANAAFTILCGLIAMLKPIEVAAFTGVAESKIVIGLGVFLIVVGASMAATAWQRPLNKLNAILLTLGDVGYVAASVAVVFLFPDHMNEWGKGIVLGVASIVVIFVVAQAVGLKRLSSR